MTRFLLQVNEPYHPGPVAVVVDCPDPDYLASLLNAPIWKRFWKQEGTAPAPAGGEDAFKLVDVMCHLARTEVCPPLPLRHPSKLSAPVLPSPPLPSIFPNFWTLLHDACGPR